jgi:hypothetical protein
MKDDLPQLAKEVRDVFLVPPEFSVLAEPVVSITEALHPTHKAIALAFLDNLHSVVRTLSIPFQYTYAQVQSLHHQRFVLAERIRAQKLPGEPDSAEDQASRNRLAAKKAQDGFNQFAETDGRKIMPREVLERLASLKDDPEGLTAARELTRQGVTLVWGAFEVLARDLFVELLNRFPGRAEMLLSNPSNRKRFGIDKLDWATLSSYGFDLSQNVGTLLAQRADLDDVPTIKDAYGALFPEAGALIEKLADRRLWVLFQKRNLIVHRRGIVDQQYKDKTGEEIPLGSQLWVAPIEVESFLSATVITGSELIKQVSNAG